MQRFQIKKLLSPVMSAGLLVASLLAASQANATITILGATGVSGSTIGQSTNTTTTTTTTTTPTIYGGNAGVSINPGAAQNGDGTVDTCNNIARLSACNNHAILSTTQLTITLKSDSTDGIPFIESVSSVSGGATTTLQPVGTPGTVSKNSTASVTYTWGTICTQMVAGGQTAIGNDCSPTTTAAGTAATYQFTIGIQPSTVPTTGPTPTTGTSPDTTTLTITVAADVGQDLTGATNTGTSTVAACDATTPANDQGICHFEVGPGDQRVILKSLQGASNFPSLGAVPIANAVLMWIETPNCTTGQPCTGNFTSIGSPSAADNGHHAFLAVTNDSGTINVSPYRVDGLSNDQFYSFKIALQDLAGNIGYFTADGDADTSCIYTSDPTGTTCHVAEPGEVVGVLSKTLNCFVATAAYGSAMAPEVDTFRKFRNDFLLTTKWGRSFVRFYYKHSPYYAGIIARHNFLRTMARGALWPLLEFARLATRYGIVTALSILAGAILLSIAAFFAVKRVAFSRGECA